MLTFLCFQTVFNPFYDNILHFYFEKTCKLYFFTTVYKLGSLRHFMTNKIQFYDIFHDKIVHLKISLFSYICIYIKHYITFTFYI